MIITLVVTIQSVLGDGQQLQVHLSTMYVVDVHDREN